MSEEQRAPVTVDFENGLQTWFDEARRGGQDMLDVRAGDLHRRVGGYPGHNHRMPLACHVMRAAMLKGDTVISEPPRKQGASLTIRFRLRRD